ncbi:MAG: DUF2341 domain-containing protein, partial [Candidatus Kariarchaeaceae archaeon]
MGNKQSFLLHMTAVLALLTLLTLSPVNGEIVMFTANTPSSISDVDSNGNIGSSTNPVSYTSTVNGQNQIFTEEEESINPQNWPYYKNIYINNSNIDSQLSNFPLLLDIKDADLKTYAQADGDDIAFFDERGLQMAHEIQSYDPSFNSTHASLTAWVKVPTVYASIDTRVEMRYGNSTMLNQENPTGTWNTFNNVWHLEEDPSGVAPQSTDELGNNDGTSAGSMTSSDLISGPIGSGIDFDGVDDSVNVGDLGTDAWTEFSISLWYNQSVNGDDRVFGYATSGDTSSSIFSVLVGNAGEGSVTVRVGTDGVGGSVSSSISSTSAFTLNTWNHISLSWSATTETIRIVLNGQLLRTAFKDGDSLTNLAAQAAIGNANGIGTDRYLTGQIDEVRISSDDRSDAWFKAEYTNQNNPGIFFSMTTSKSFDVFDAVDTVSQGTPLSEIGSQSNYADMRAVDGQMNTLTELQRPLNNRSLISNGAGSMRIGGGTEDWRRTSGTISFWVQWVGAPTGTQRPWGQGQDFEARVGPIDATVFRMTLDWGGDNSLVSQYNLTAGQWYFFGITWDQAIDDLYLYIGSESTFPLSTESNTAWTSDITLDPLLVNEFLSSRGSGNYVNGRGDELTFFDKALTQSELDYVHDHVLSGSEDNLISLFTFDGLNQDSNLMDIGPAGADGTQFGTLSYSTSEPDPPNTDYVYFNEFQFNNVPYTRTVGTLAIKTGNFGAEALGVDYWTGTSWSTLSNNLVANSWNNFSLSSELSSSTFTIRLIDETRNLDTTPNTWEIDAVILDYENYRLDMEHSITGVDRDREYYDLTIYGQSSSASENYGASIWTGASWTSDLVTITSTLAWYNNSITGHEYSTTMYIKYQDLNTARDNLQNSLNLDYVGINSYDIDPVITSSPGNLVYVEGTTSNIATWQFTDDSPNNYNIYVDDVAQGLTAYSSPATVNFNIDGLERGTHNITIEIFDDYTGYTVDQITVTVNDETNPTIDSPSDFVMVEQIIGNALNWSANDLHPDTYTIYRNGSSIDTGSWLNGQNISISLNGLAKGTWNYTVEARDDSNNPITDTIFVTVNDETPPDIDPTSNVNYDEDSTGNYLSWTANDFYPDNYVLYQNGSQINASTWISGNPIRQNIDGLVVGDYNYTIVIFDASNNYAINTIWVFSRDTTPPSVSGPGTIAYEQGSSGNSITWTLSDTNPPMNVIVYKNGSQLFSTPMPNGQFVLGIDGLGLGTYNYTIHVTDFYGNSNVDTVIVTVNDTIIPVITSPAANTTMSEGSSGNSLTWIVTDNNPDTFTVYNNGTGEAPAPWFSGVDTEYDLDSLTKGTYNITITFVDDAGNEISYTVWVTVLDQTSPTITRPANIQYEYGVTPNTITWTATDTYAATYI